MKTEFTSFKEEMVKIFLAWSVCVGCVSLGATIFILLY